jgi:hypothetical protein
MRNSHFALLVVLITAALANPIDFVLDMIGWVE